MASRLRVKPDRKPAMIITRRAVRSDKLVYVARANKRVRYKYGRSQIVYFGTTKKGAKRIAQSAASRAPKLLDIHGVTSLEFHTVTCSAVKGLQSWRLLERALILRFRERFGVPPISNVIGKKMKANGEQRYFAAKRLDAIIDAYS